MSSPPPAKRVAPSEPARLYFGIDIEKAGRHSSDSIISVGLCVADTRSGTIQKLRVSPPDGNRFEARCICEFWSNHPELLKRFTLERCESVENALSRISSFLSSHEEKTVPEVGPAATYNGRAILVSDNPAYDVAQLDAGMERWTTKGGVHIPLHYTRSGAYRPVSDSCERIEALGLDEERLKAALAALGIRTSHMPEEDAECHVWMLFLSKAFARVIVEGEESKALAEIKREFYEAITLPEAREWILRKAREHDGDA